MNIRKMIKDLMLPIAMVSGASVYLAYDAMPESIHRFGPFLSDAVGVLQPLLIFSMLFLTFCQIEPKDLKLHRWHWWLLLIQGGLFTILGFVAVVLMRLLPEGHEWIVLVESAMLCLICPTATAAAVVTRKLGGDVPGITTYIVLINILTAVLVPLMVPLVRPSADTGFLVAFGMIISKVFPLLICPCLCAWIVRYFFPKTHRWLMRFPDMAFYLWSVGLTLAIAVTTKTIVNSSMPLTLLFSMAGVSLLCCIFQFAAGRRVGGRYRPKRADAGIGVELRGKAVRKVTAGQSLGQKNTIFAIWMGYTFLTPETSVIGGFYSIWHNIYNSWQLCRAKK